jgi:hypothetical protein
LGETHHRSLNGSDDRRATGHGVTSRAAINMTPPNRTGLTITFVPTIRMDTARNRNRHAMSSFRRALADYAGRPNLGRTIARPSSLPEPAIRQLDQRRFERAEADLCDVLADHLRADGWEVYFEVPLGRSRPDIVAIRHDETLAVEAKLEAVRAVVRQGLRIARRIARPYIALPVATAGTAAATITRIDRGQRLPGIFAVGSSVHEIRPPTGPPGRLLRPELLRAIALRYGGERGGVPSVSQIERNLAIVADLDRGETVLACAAKYRISGATVRTIAARLRRWRSHLETCVACTDPVMLGAHRYATLIEASASR